MGSFLKYTELKHSHFVQNNDISLTGAYCFQTDLMMKIKRQTKKISPNWHKDKYFVVKYEK